MVVVGRYRFFLVWNDELRSMLSVGTCENLAVPAFLINNSNNNNSYNNRNNNNSNDTNFALRALCCPSGNLSHGKFGSLSPRKASCNGVALPNPN